MNDSNMSTHKKVTITLHPIEIEKIKKIAKSKGETISGMIARLIQEYKLDERDLKDLTELSSEIHKKSKDTGDLTDPDYDRRFRCKGKNQ